MTKNQSRRWVRARLTWAISLALAVPMLDAAPPEGSARHPSVLLLFSLRNTAPAVGAMESGFRETIEKRLGAPVDLHVEYLDLTDPSASVYGKLLTDLLRQKYSARPIDLVVAASPEALRFVQDNREGLFAAAQVVFVNVDRDALSGGPLPRDTTGSILPLEEQKTVRIAVGLHPDAQGVVILAGASPNDRNAEALARRLAGQAAPGLEILSLAGLPLPEQLERIANLPEKSVVIFTSYRADSRGLSTIARDMLRRFAKVSNAPIYGASETFLGNGIVGGDLIRYGPIGERAGALAARILGGERAAAIAPVEEPASQVMFDWRQLRRWKIDEKRLPPGSVVLFREKTLWSEYRWRIVGLFALFLLQWAGIAALLRANRTRRRAEADLVAAEERYRTVADFTQDWETWKRPDGTFAYVSPSCAETTGYAADEFYRQPSLTSDLILEEDREAWREHDADAMAGRAPRGFEFRIRTKDGRIRWIEHVCRKVTGKKGEFLGVRGSNRDITRRKESDAELRSAFTEIERLRERLEADNTYLREQLQPEQGVGGIVGSSDALRYVLSKAQQVAATSSTVLLLGETGVGKDLIARAIHGLSPRRNRPLVTLNCAALPQSLVESELFGHEKGAFTGAVSLRKGRFEIADGSTLFLDEVGELPLELQAKLLRVIQDGAFERVGGTATLKTDARLIAATNRRLDEDVKAGRFRADLWYRLNVFPITVPPLRQRREDIPLLVTYFIQKHCRKVGKPPLDVSVGTVKDLQSREWPGNVRELESVIERAVVSNTGPSLRIGRDLRPGSGETPLPATSSGAARTLSQLERDHIVATLEQTYWRLEGEGGAAERLGINASTLRSRMSKHGIRRPGSRPMEDAV